MAERIWVRGVKGRLTRIERGGPFLSISDWKQVNITKRIQQKADRGSLEISYRDPAGLKVKEKPAVLANKEKETSE